VDQLRVRNKEIRRVRVADILDNPANARTHPDPQVQAFGGTVDDPDVFEHPDYPGQYMLSDGHLRRSWLAEHYGFESEIEVNLTDLTPDEAKFAIATKDTIAAMAQYDTGKLDQLLREINTGSQAVADMLEAMAEEHGLLAGVVAGPDDFKQLGEDIETEFRCPKCGYEWSGSPKPE